MGVTKTYILNMLKSGLYKAMQFRINDSNNVVEIRLGRTKEVLSKYDTDLYKKVLKLLEEVIEGSESKKEAVNKIIGIKKWKD